jgi:hypothetical protein
MYCYDKCKNNYKQIQGILIFRIGCAELAFGSVADLRFRINNFELAISDLTNLDFNPQSKIRNPKSYNDFLGMKR